MRKVFLFLKKLNEKLGPTNFQRDLAAAKQRAREQMIADAYLYSRVSM